jgi:hypothetical protein
MGCESGLSYTQGWDRKSATVPVTGLANLYDRWFQHLWCEDSHWGRNRYECRQLIIIQNYLWI